jgi:hypothetical protein
MQDMTIWTERSKGSRVSNVNSIEKVEIQIVTDTNDGS